MYNYPLKLTNSLRVIIQIITHSCQASLVSDTTRLTVLTNAERNKFDAPPKFNAEERTLYFALAQNDLAIVENFANLTSHM